MLADIPIVFIVLGAQPRLADLRVRRVLDPVAFASIVSTLSVPLFIAAASIIPARNGVRAARQREARPTRGDTRATQRRARVRPVGCRNLG
jgi:hypothetical protein